MARLAYLGSPHAAVVPLAALVEAGHDVALVVSRADARRGRGSAVSPSPVKAAALELGLAVSDRLDDVVQAGVELAVVVAYGRIVPAPVLEALPMVNLHFSLLPRWRGAAPVERAILAGDDATGVCVMRLEEGLDTGPVLARQAVPMDDAHAGELLGTLSAVGAELLVGLLGAGVDALGPGAPQEGEATYADKLRTEELRLDWTRTAAELRRLVRLDRAFTTFRGKRLLVPEALPIDTDVAGPPGTLEGTAVATGGGGALRLVVVQPEGKRAMDAEQWARGLRLEPDERLGGAGPDG